jgi:dihydroxyacetone kinase-like protein
MTAIEMAGCSITLLKLDDQLIELLEAPADTIAWKK